MWLKTSDCDHKNAGARATAETVHLSKRAVRRELCLNPWKGVCRSPGRTGAMDFCYELDQDEQGADSGVCLVPLGLVA